MNLLKEFEEWYERRQITARTILVALPVVSFLVSFGLMFLPVLLGDIYRFEWGYWRFVIYGSFVITGSVVLFIIWSIHKVLNKDMFVFLVLGLFLPFAHWGYYVFAIVAMGMYLYWQISLLILTPVCAILILWKLWGKRKREWSGKSYLA